MNYENLLIKKKNNWAKIIFNRPDKLNSFNRSMSDEFLDVLNLFDEDDNIRSIVITGAGKGFSAGQDLEEALSGQYSVEEILDKQYNPIILKIRNLKKPVIAAINGVAAGAGANIAFACDVTIANESATFIQAFSKIGLIPDSGGTYFLPKLIGLAKASALMMTADKITAQEAEKMNLIYKCVSDNEFDKYVDDTAEKLANMPTVALSLIKKAINRSFYDDELLPLQLELEKELQIKASETYDYKEGVRAFLEKRKPNFIGK